MWGLGQRPKSISTHSLTRRLTHFLYLVQLGFHHFNSQPHEEADGVCRQTIATIMKISTHSLTRRLTASVGFGATPQEYFNSQPHEEADRRGTLSLGPLRHFNSQPHEEADGGEKVSAKEVITFQLTASRGG